MKITSKQQVIERLNKIAEFGWRNYDEKVIANDWVKVTADGKEYNRTYFKIRETADFSKHFCEYKFGYWDNIKNVYVTDRFQCDLNWSLHGSDIGLEKLEA